MLRGMHTMEFMNSRSRCHDPDINVCFLDVCFPRCLSLMMTSSYIFPVMFVFPSLSIIVFLWWLFFPDVCFQWYLFLVMCVSVDVCFHRRFFVDVCFYRCLFLLMCVFKIFVSNDCRCFFLVMCVSVDVCLYKCLFLLVCVSTDVCFCWCVFSKFLFLMIVDVVLICGNCQNLQLVELVGGRRCSKSRLNSTQIITETGKLDRQAEVVKSFRGISNVGITGLDHKWTADREFGASLYTKLARCICWPSVSGSTIIY